MTNFPFEAEVRLIRWGESSSAGRTITLELSPDQGDGHPFKGFPTGHQHGQRFRIQFMPIGDDEQSVERRTSKQVYADKSPEDRIVARAGALAGDKDFQQWLLVSGRVDPLAWEISYGSNQEKVEARIHETEDFIRRSCGVASRSELATNVEAREFFVKLEAAFIDWRDAGLSEVDHGERN